MNGTTLKQNMHEQLGVMHGCNNADNLCEKVDEQLNTRSNKHIAFSPPDITDLEIQEVVKALKSGWITTGPRTKELERRLSAYFGTIKTACLNSQTACAEMALHLMGIGPGDEVITSAYTYTASASVVCHVGAKLVLIDTQQDSLEMDYDQLESAITERTKAIIPVDIGGVPCDYDRIFRVVENTKHLFHAQSELQAAIGRIAVLEDAAHGMGALWHGKQLGQIADMTSFSFHAVKNFTTAEGGALTWRSFPGVSDEKLYNQIQLLSLHGQSKDALAKTKLGAWEYDIVGPWYKCNMTDVVAAIGLKQFERYPAMLKRRKEIIKRYDEALRPLGVRTLKHYTDDYESSGHLYMVHVPWADLELRQEIITRMAEYGIACNVHYKPLPMMTAYKNLGFSIEDYPNAYSHFVNEITLPLHTLLTDEDVQYIVERMTDILQTK